MTATTLRLIMPQWQGGNEPAYHFSAKLLHWLASSHDGPEEIVPILEHDGSEPKIKKGIKWREALLRQAKKAWEAIERHKPDRIVTFGGDCLVDLAPIAYLNRKYAKTLGVLWIDSHPDILSAAEFSHAHAHILAILLGRGDADFTAQVPKKLIASQVMIAGMQEWSTAEDRILKEFNIPHITASALSHTNQPILDWIARENITHLAVHFDLDVLDPSHFSPLLFNKPNPAKDAFACIAQGKMHLEQVVQLLKDASIAADMVGLALTEHLAWDMLRLKNALAELPIMKS